MNLRTQIARTEELSEALQLAAEASAGTNGMLHMADGTFKACVYLESGRIVAAQIKGKDVVSLQALQEIVQHRQAAFMYEAGTTPEGLKRVNFPFQELLKQGLKLVERTEPNDPSVVGKDIDKWAMRTHTNLVPIDATQFAIHEKLTPDEDEDHEK
jgi:hypothetical protein